MKKTKTLNNAPEKGLFSRVYNFIAKSKTDTKRFVFVYSAFFAVMALLVYTPYIVRGRSFIWETDGLSQHYLALMAIGKWVREIFTNIFVEHTFAIPMWDFGIGTGGDIITTFNYYGLGDPLCFLSALVPEQFTVHLFNFLVIVRLYLSGLFFSFYCFRMKQRGAAVFIGAIAYVFSAYAIYAGARHPFFLVPMVFFPLMLIGVERILNSESPVLFIVSVFCSFTINFYFSFTLVILTVIYIMARFFTVKENRKFGLFIKKFLQFLVSGVIGVLMSCAILLPVLIVFLGNGRSDVARNTQVLYDVLYYSRLYARFMSFSLAGSWTITGFIPPLVLSLLLLFKRRKEYTFLKVIFVVMTVILFIPVLGKITNGMAYTANRWIWGYSFILSFIFVVMYENLKKLAKKEKTFLFASVAIYLLTSLFVTNVFNISITSQYVILGILTVLFLAGDSLFSGNASRKINIITAVLSVIAILFNSFYQYSFLYVNYVDEFIKTADAYDMVSNSVSSNMSEELNKEFCRFEQITNEVRNAGVVDGTNGVSYYWSLNDSKVGDYLKETESVIYTSYDYLHLNRRTAIDELFCVKYFFTDCYDLPVPFGYEYDKTISTYKGDFDVYKNKYALPLGFTYSDYMTRDEYSALTAAEKQEALMSNVLLEKDLDGYNKNTFALSSYDVPYTITCDKGISVKDNKIIVEDEDAWVTLEFEPVSNCELYVDFLGLYCDDVYDDLDLQQIKNNGKTWNKMSVLDKIKKYKTDIYERDSDMFTFKVSSNGYSPVFHLSTPDYQNYDGCHDFLSNLCYDEEERNTIKFKVDTPGVYSFDEINVIAQPMENYVDNATARAENVLENIEITDNQFSGEIDLDSPQLLFLSAPYVNGFTAYVDGEEAEILQANTWGMALDLDAGHHEIVFKYRTPGLYVGIAMSCVGFTLFALTLIYLKKKSK